MDPHEPIIEPHITPDSIGEVGPMGWFREGLVGLTRGLENWLEDFKGLLAFFLIAVGVALTKFGVSPRVIRPLMWREIFRGGVKLLPMVCFMGLALGVVVVGQVVVVLSKVGAEELAGKIMVSVVIREIGPIMATWLVLSRIGTASVIELGTARVLGEVEALESMGIDPMHYLVLPKMVGLSITVFAQTVYLVLVALVSGYLIIFLQDIPIRPSQYFGQIAEALRWNDFIFITLKTALFGVIIGVVVCYEGLAKPLKLQEVSMVTTRAVLRSLEFCVGLDVLFIIYQVLLSV